MKINSININIEVLQDYSKSEKREAKDLMIHAIAMGASAGVGYISTTKLVDEIVNLCDVSRRTAWRWIERLRYTRLARIRKGFVRPLSRKKLESQHDCGRTQIRFELEHLSSYKNFRDHLIQQIALLTQRGFEYMIKLNKGARAKSLYENGKISGSLELVTSEERTGCSLSQLEKKLSFDKKTLSGALKGRTTKMRNKTQELDGKSFRAKYGAKLIDMSKETRLRTVSGITELTGRLTHPKFSYTYNSKKDTYTVYCAIASRINVESYINRKRVKPKKVETVRVTPPREVAGEFLPDPLLRNFTFI